MAQWYLQSFLCKDIFASMPEAARNIELTDPRTLRAVAHPLRMRLIGLLRQEGPLTATRAGQLLGESSGSCSFHLRQLAKYGMVEEAGGGHGREKPWRATAMSTSWPSIPDTPEATAAAQLFTTVVADRYLELMRTWIAVSPDEPDEWRAAAAIGDSIIYATPDELTELMREMVALVERYSERITKPETRPPGSRPISVLHVAVPNDRRPSDA
jgi:predicted ArsR family transcriptional regulator